MNSLNKVIRTISLIGVCALAVTTVRAVIPPPDGGYPGNNTAEGTDALLSLTSGVENTAVGFQALSGNATSGGNTAIGNASLEVNSGGNYNTALGDLSLAGNMSGSNNTAIGFEALLNNTTSINNTALGAETLVNNNGANNTAAGDEALLGNTTGSNNTGYGYKVLNSNTTGSNNIALGASAGSSLTTGSNNIDIGGFGVAGESNTIRLGKSGVQKTTYITGIRGATVAGGVTVMVDGSGHLGTITSSARFKDAIKPMGKASEALLSLQPVTFRYKKALDPERIPQFGLVAEQVAKVDPDLVARDDNGEPYTVRYEAVNAMMLNEFLKAHRRAEEQDKTVSELQSLVAQQQTQIKELASQIKSVRQLSQREGEK